LRLAVRHAFWDLHKELTVERGLSAMAFFDDLGKKLSQTGQEAVNKAKEFAETTKLNSLIDSEEKNINSLYSKIGARYFELFAENPEEGMVEFFIGINESKKKIAEFREQLLKVKGADAAQKGEACPNCGTINPTGALFCSKCGFKLSVDKAEAAIPPLDTKTCPSCGKQLPTEAVFCNGCGQRQE
jgi:ribosomal protein L40E